MSGPARRDEIIAAARELMDEGGLDALSMRRVAEAVGIRAASLYEHVAGKAELEVFIAESGLHELARALAGADDSLRSIALQYRRWALQHPALFRVTMQRQLRGDLLATGTEASVSSRLLALTGGDRYRAHVYWATAHGLIDLELTGSYLTVEEIDEVWRVAFPDGPHPG